MIISQLFESERSIEPFKEKFPFSLYTGTAMTSGFHEWRFRTKPRDTFRPIHNTISKQSMDKFGIDVRALLFATNVMDVAKEYAENTEGGRVKKIYPVGERFRIFNSTRSTDMTATLKIGSAQIFAEIMVILKDMRLAGVFWGFKEFVQKCFKEYRDFEGDFDAFEDDMIEKICQYNRSIEDLKKDRGVKFDEEEFIKNFRDRMNRVRKRFSKYIETVVEIKSARDDKFSLVSEVMIYAPDGFIVE